MLTLEDCVALGALSTEEIDVLAAHEHLPDIVACELGNYLLSTPGGAMLIADGIRAQIVAARRHHRVAAASRLEGLLVSFERKHCRALR
jgi:hypothetical protein